jgi:hypothetical protein
MRFQIITCTALAILSWHDAGHIAFAQFTVDDELGAIIIGGDELVPDRRKRPTDDTRANVLSPAQWQHVDAAVARGLKWLASEQQPDGSFLTLETGQPGVTSLCMMAFIAHGYVPGEGPYGKRLERATEYVLSCQKKNGLISRHGPDGDHISRQINHEVGSCAAYNHGISSLVLSEIYGMSPPDRARSLQVAIDKALEATLVMQQWPKDMPRDRGGWRYIDDFDRTDSDLSVTGWQLMFLRSAQNAGFNVPKERIEEAVAFVRRSYDTREGIFVYNRSNSSRTRSMAGAGILALAHSGLHHTEESRRSGDWLLRHQFGDYNVALPGARSDRYHYGVFTCCQAMYQLGGIYWERFYPSAVRAVLTNQQPDGSWPIDSQYKDAAFGSTYTTALVIMMLGAPNQLLPIFQR